MIDNDRLIEIVDNTDTGTCNPHQIKNHHHHHDHGTAQIISQFLILTDVYPPRQPMKHMKKNNAYCTP